MFQCKMSKVSSGLKKNSSFSGVTVAKTSQFATSHKSDRQRNMENCQEIFIFPSL